MWLLLLCPFLLFLPTWLIIPSQCQLCPLKNIFFYLLIFRERKEGKEEGREREIERHVNLLFTYSCIHWLILICALTGDRTHNLCVSGQCSDQLSYLARANSELCNYAYSCVFSLFSYVSVSCIRPCHTHPGISNV